MRFIRRLYLARKSREGIQFNYARASGRADLLLLFHTFPDPDNDLTSGFSAFSGTLRLFGANNSVAVYLLEEVWTTFKFL